MGCEPQRSSAFDDFAKENHPIYQPYPTPRNAGFLKWGVPQFHSKCVLFSIGKTNWCWGSGMNFKRHSPAKSFLSIYVCFVSSPQMLNGVGMVSGATQNSKSKLTRYGALNNLRK
jgi:hypothetical protein